MRGRPINVVAATLVKKRDETEFFRRSFCCGDSVRRVEGLCVGKSFLRDESMDCCGAGITMCWE
jgi:hypothetical protein